MANFILFGFKGCGKSYWGMRFAAESALHFIDTDELLSDAQGQPCSEIYRRVGEKEFRKLEAEVIHSLSRSQNSLIALGGGAILHNQLWLQQLGQLLYLKCSKVTLKKRILNPPLPPFLDPKDPEASFETYYHERLQWYEKIPAHILDVEQGDLMKEWKKFYGQQ